VANVSGGLRADSGEIDTSAIRYYTGAHVDGQTQTRPAADDVGLDDPSPDGREPSVYRRLNELLAEHVRSDIGPTPTTTALEFSRESAEEL
jgi:hypothetical protein